jgi:hypothetical protein
MNLPTSQSAYPGDVVTNHDDLIKFLASQQKRINLLETHVRGLRGTYDLLRESNNNRYRVVLDSPKAEKPLLAVGQQWKRRDGKVVTIERLHRYTFWTENVAYNPDGVCRVSPSPSPYDLIELVKQGEQVEPPSSGLQWTENRQPNEECRYNHCIAETPFGRFLITWKDWKAYNDPTVDETPWGDWYGVFNSVDEAKTACQSELNAKLLACAALFASTQSNP